MDWLPKAMAWAHRAIPQKVRFTIGVIFVFPIVLVVTLIGVLLAWALAMWDVLKDGYHGKFQRDFDEYVIDRILK